MNQIQIKPISEADIEGFHSCLDAVARDRRLERVELDVYASNVPAISLYEKFKFQVEGRKRRARKLDGTYDDIIVMAIVFEQ